MPKNLRVRLGALRDHKEWLDHYWTELTSGEGDPAESLAELAAFAAMVAREAAFQAGQAALDRV